MWVQLVIAIVMAVASYFLTPKPKQQKTQTLKPQEVTTPMVTAGSPIQVVFGRLRIRNPNVLAMAGQRSKAVKK